MYSNKYMYHYRCEIPVLGGYHRAVVRYGQEELSHFYHSYVGNRIDQYSMLSHFSMLSPDANHLCYISHCTGCHYASCRPYQGE